MFRTVPLSIIRSFSLYTQQWYMSYRFADSKPLWHIPLLCVHWKAPDDGQRNCPKHVEFYSKNKFEKLLHPVGFIIRKSVHWIKYFLKRTKFCDFSAYSAANSARLSFQYTFLILVCKRLNLCQNRNVYSTCSFYNILTVRTTSTHRRPLCPTSPPRPNQSSNNELSVIHSVLRHCAVS